MLIWLYVAAGFRSNRDARQPESQAPGWVCCALWHARRSSLFLARIIGASLDDALVVAMGGRAAQIRSKGAAYWGPSTTASSPARAHGQVYGKAVAFVVSAV